MLTSFVTIKKKSKKSGRQDTYQEALFLSQFIVGYVGLNEMKRKILF